MHSTIKIKWRGLVFGLLLGILFGSFFRLLSYADISWSGESGGSSGGGNAATDNSFTLASTKADDILGYRFSIVDNSGQLVSDTQVLDVYATQSRLGNDGLSRYHGGLQYNKTSFVNNYYS